MSEQDETKINAVSALSAIGLATASLFMPRHQVGGKIRIPKSATADTRIADHEITKEELRASSWQHIQDVHEALDFIAYELQTRGRFHDKTKITHLNEFYEQFHKAQQTGSWGKGWFDQIHIVQERHHLKDHCPEDVNLIDVLEMLCDCVMAGLARSGKYREEEPDADMLVKAYKNTVKMLVDVVEVVD